MTLVKTGGWTSETHLLRTNLVPVETAAPASDLNGPKVMEPFWREKKNRTRRRKKGVVSMPTKTSNVDIVPVGQGSSDREMCASTNAEFSRSNLADWLHCHQFPNFQFNVFIGPYSVQNKSISLGKVGMTLQTKELHNIAVRCMFSPCIALKAGGASIKGFTFQPPHNSKNRDVTNLPRGIVGQDFLGTFHLENCIFIKYEMK